jgi:hypothetical protein
MKAFAILPAAAAAVLALNISSASSQGACMQEYQACMTSCSSKPVKALQDGCFQNCEGKNTFCAERVYGKRPFNGAASSVAEQNGPAKEALAKKEKAQNAPQQPAADDRAPQQNEAAPQPRGSVRR